MRGLQCHQAGLMEPQVDCLRMQEGRAQDPWFQISPEGRLRFVILVKHFLKLFLLVESLRKRLANKLKNK